MNQLAVHVDLALPPANLRRRVSDLWSLVEEDMESVERRLTESMDSPIGRIPEVGSHLLGAGGKRLRPLLAVLVARAGGCDVAAAVAAGCAAELIHSATLFHDDVVDGGSVRRGRPAARMIYGNGLAVLVGDFCLARGLDLVAATGSIVMVRTLAATVTEMAEGEVAQLEGAGNPDVTIASYLQVVDRKTASLMAWCARVGGLLPGALDGPLGRYGRALGRAFQIADDILDCAAGESTTGKSGGRDLQEGKLTLPVLLACESDRALRARIREGLRAAGMAAETAQTILLAVRTAGGVERARKRALALTEEAIAELVVLPASPYREALAELARLAVDRVA
ncbi:MAG: polyprenyl synthetase family protein [Deltaproteobacteria bacterium]|nr:polyprenyl synthetase family protein [Deltaproteobacteria bacterium]